MVENTPEQAVVALSLASRLYLSAEERKRIDLSSLIQSAEYGDILADLARLALQEDINPCSPVLAEKYRKQRLILQTRFDLNEVRLRSIEETAQKLSWTRGWARRTEDAAIKRIRLLETPMWQAFKIFFLKGITKI